MPIGEGWNARKGPSGPCDPLCTWVVFLLWLAIILHTAVVDDSGETGQERRGKRKFIITSEALYL